MVLFDSNKNNESSSAQYDEGRAESGSLSLTLIEPKPGVSAGDTTFAEVSKLDGQADLAGKQPNGLLSRFTGAALHSALQAPVNGITQLVDNVAGTTLHEKVKSKEWFAAPEEAKFGSLDWHVQQIGNAVGIAADFIVLNKGLKSAARGLVAVNERGMPARAMTAFVNKPILNATISGGLYDGLFRESASSENLLGSRLKQSGIGAATFATLSGIGSSMRTASAAGLFGKGIAQRMVGNQAAVGFISGVPAGILNAELNSGGKASFEDLYKSAYGFAFLGGAVGGINALSGKLSRSSAAEREGARKPEPTGRPGEKGKQPAPTQPETTGKAEPVLDKGVRHNPETHFSQSWPMTIDEHPFAPANLTTSSPGVFSRQRVAIHGALEDGSSIFKVNDSLRARLRDTASNMALGGPFHGIKGAIDKWWLKPSTIEQSPQPTEVTLFLEGGGANGWRHIGVLRALEEANLKVGNVYTASVGTVIGALIAKGKNSAEIERAFLTEFQTPLVQATLPKGPGWRAFVNRADPGPMIRHWVDKYGLEPSDKLHIGTFYARERRLHWVEGTGYNIADAMAASMNIPGVFSFHRFSRENLGLGSGKPVTMLDGGIRKVTADDLPKFDPIVISRLDSRQSGFQYNAINNRFLHWLGNVLAKPLNRNLEAPDGDAIVIYPKGTQINAMDFNQPEAVNRALIKDGYETAKAALKKAKKEGRLSPAVSAFTYQIEQSNWPETIGWSGPGNLKNSTVKQDTHQSVMNRRPDNLL